MATPVLLGTLVQRVRQRANLEVGPAVTSAQAFPDSEVIDAINQSLFSWWDMVRLTTFGGQYARVPYPIVTDGRNPALYPMPANCASIISVDANINGTSYAINAMSYQEENRNAFKQFPAFAGWGYGSVWYQKQGENISFLPVLPSGYNIQINYVPTAPQLQDQATDYLNSFNGWEEWVVLDAAIKLLVKDGQTDMIQALQGMKQEQADRILHAAAMADMNSSEGVHEGQEPSSNGYGYGMGGMWGGF